MYGSLTVITGPMYGGKTTELLSKLLWEKNIATKKKRSVIMVKPSFDNRYSEQDVVSHDGISAEAISISDWSEIEDRYDSTDSFFFDEIQFFTEPHFKGDIIAIINQALRDGKDVVTNGLDMDWKGKPFYVTSMLMGMADTVLKKKAHCAVCGKPATKTFKKGGSESSVELGGNDLYEPRCNAHFSSRG